jgi:hypothetical protein
MLKTIHTVCTYLIIALGLLHLLFTFHDYDAFTLRALWFAGAGFAIIFAGFLNLISLRLTQKETLVGALCIIANVICAGLFAAALWLMQQPQVFVGVLLFTLAAAAAAARQKSAHN